MEKNTLVLSRRGGLFNERRQTREVVHPVFGSFLVRITGSGHITLRAAFGTDGQPLAIPEKGKGQQGITLDASSGGRVSEELWGWKANKHLEYSSGEHQVLAIARAIFYQIYLQIFLKVQTEPITTPAIDWEEFLVAISNPQ
jgi:hypothetical protein